jgi:TATA-binding protein-associated factor
MPTVTYLRLDGSGKIQIHSIMYTFLVVNPMERQKIVDQFNRDPTIDVLLLTTAVGGVGLTLTGADTVIFLEHDWNPTKDLQVRQNFVIQFLKNNL